MKLSDIVDASKHPPQGHLELALNETGKMFINQPYAYEGFSQVNAQQNHILLDLLSQAATKYVKNNPVILDLFGGNGNLTHHIEASQRHVFDLYKKIPAPKNGQTFYSQDLYAKDAINQLAKICPHPDLIILDPPRSGFKELGLLVKNFKPDMVFYVSCNPATFARDLSSIENYSVLEIHLIDFFPCTYHFETFGILVKQ